MQQPFHLVSVLYEYFLHFNINYNNNQVQDVLLSHILQMIKESFMEAQGLIK